MRDDSQRRFLAQHSVARLEQCCNHSKQCRNNVATLCCAKARRCQSSRVTSRTLAIERERQLTTARANQTTEREIGNESRV